MFHISDILNKYVAYRPHEWDFSDQLSLRNPNLSYFLPKYQQKLYWQFKSKQIEY